MTQLGEIRLAQEDCLQKGCGKLLLILKGWGYTMNIYPEIKKIAGKNEQIKTLAEKVEEKLLCEGMDWQRAYFVDGIKERGGHLYQNGCRLDNSGNVGDEYYCDQHTGYCEDDYYGTLYFKTNVPGQFVAVPFEM